MTEESEDEDENVVHRHKLQWCSHGKHFIIILFNYFSKFQLYSH